MSLDVTATPPTAAAARRVVSPARLAAACGALYPLGILLGDDAINGAGEAPDLGASTAEVGAYLRDAADAGSSYWIGRGIGTLAFVALLVFAVHVAAAIRSRARDAGLLTGLSLAGGILAAAFGMLAALAQFTVVERAADGIDPELARLMLNFAGIAFGLVLVPQGLLLAATAASGVLPRWLAIAAVPLAAWGAVGALAVPAAPESFAFPLVLSWLWFLAASVALVRRA